MAFENILVERSEALAFITLNRADKMNILDRKTIGELGQALEEVDNDDAVRVVILTGAGEKAFAAGADVGEFADYKPEEGKEMSRDGHEKLFDKVEQLGTPVIAAINGFALGGGLELAMACHIRVASENAKLGLPEVSLGVIPGYGGTQRLPRLVGRGKATEMIATARKLSAEEARSDHLVEYVTTQEELMEQSKAIAARIEKNSPAAITQALSAINAGYDGAKNGFEEESKAFGACFEANDFKEGMDAFMNKRKPEFKGN